MQQTSYSIFENLLLESGTGATVDASQESSAVAVSGNALNLGLYVVNARNLISAATALSIDVRGSVDGVRWLTEETWEISDAKLLVPGYFQALVSDYPKLDEWRWPWLSFRATLAAPGNGFAAVAIEQLSVSMWEKA